MRSRLDPLYNAAAYVAALLLVGTLVMILLGIFGRILDFQVRGSDAYAGYLMAGSGFLALAHTLRRGEHIRVTVITQMLKGRAHRAVELVAVVIGAVLSLLLAWFSIRLVWQSYTLHDISSGNDATPLWIPQIAMAVGCVVFAIAILDELLRVLAGGNIDVKTGDEPLHVE